MMATDKSVDLSARMMLKKSVDTTDDNAACCKALSTLELLENVMLQLPCQDLLVSAQRVCKMWQATVSNSITLQRALCFIPAKETNCEPKEIQLPLRPAGISAADYLASCLEGPQLNPFLDKVFIEDVPQDRHLHATHRPIYVQADSESASWKRLYITQPPVSRLSLWTITLHESSLDWFVESGILTRPSAIMMRDVHEYVEEVCFSDDTSLDGISARLELDKFEL